MTARELHIPFLLAHPQSHHDFSVRLGALGIADIGLLRGYYAIVIEGR